jgi:adenine phosphoribosyltransferase
VASGLISEEIRGAIRWVDGHADVWRLFADGSLFGRCVTALVEPYRQDEITHVAGIEARGFLLGGAAAAALGVGFVALRKGVGHLPGAVIVQPTGADYKGEASELRLQADLLPQGAQVLVVDDWFETGSQFLAARALLERAGGAVVGASVIVDETKPEIRARLGRFNALVRAIDLTPER